MDNICPSDENENSAEQLKGGRKGGSSSPSNDKPQDHRLHLEDTTSSSVIQQDKEDVLEAQPACAAYCCCSDEKGFQPVDRI